MDPFIECDKCDKPINYGESFISIMRNSEVAQLNSTTNDPEVEVEECDQIITLCKRCGNLFNTDNIGKIIKAIPFGNEQVN
jgi:hypothetical protein